MEKGKFKAVLKCAAGLAAITSLAIGLTGCVNSKKETITFINQTRWYVG